ncbi:unnamed protein product [Effrenium voratum]|nr:unnamed protein product [Effrenium voratum]
MYDFLLIMKDVDQLGTWRTLGQDKGVEKELVDSFIGLWRSLARNIKEDNVSVKELQRAVKTLPGAPVKLARIRLLQQMGIEAIDFASFVQVMKTKNSELGDGLDIAESDFSGPLSPHEFMSPMITPSAPVRPAASIRRGGEEPASEIMVLW